MPPQKKKSVRKKKLKPNRKLQWRRLKSFQQGNFPVDLYSAKITEKTRIYQFHFPTPYGGDWDESSETATYKAKNLTVAKKLFRKDYKTLMKEHDW